MLWDARALEDVVEVVEEIGCPEKALVEFKMLLLYPIGEAIILFSLVQMM